MQKKKIIILFLVICIQIIDAQENYIVRDISFIGNKTIGNSELLDQMTHYSTSWFSDYILFKDPFLFSTDIFETDKANIIREYQRNGFINAKILNVNLKKDDEDKTLEIQIEISEGIPITVNSVDFKVSTDQSELLRNVKENLSLKTNIRFTDNKINSDKNVIINEFINNGYPYISVDYDLKLDTANHNVNLRWLIKEGIYSKFGEVTFEGNKRTEDDLLYEKLKFKKGEEYAANKLDRTQKNIYGLGLFYIVSISSILDSEYEQIPIKIKLQEAPQFNTKFGVGYGRDEKLRVSVDQRWLGFLGGARQLKIYAKHSDLEPYNFRLEFLQPDFVYEYTRLSISPYFIKQTEPAFTLNKLGVDLKITKPLFENVLGSFKYSFERSNLDTNSISKEELKLYNLTSVYNKSGVEIGFERSTSEPVFNPNSGSFNSLVVNYSGIGLQSKYHFLRPTIEFRKYTEISEWLIFAFRIKTGTIFSYDDDGFIPYEERFYSGGSSSVRGWARAELGPKDKEGKPLGGKSIFESNIEFRYSIYSPISGVIFLDYGNVWINELTYKLNDLRYSAGWGLRIATPIGPVRFDFANPIFEGAAKLQYFISVGHAF